MPVGGRLKLLLAGIVRIGDAAGDGDAEPASSDSSSSSESSLRSSSLNDRSLTPSSRGVNPVSSLGVCLRGSKASAHQARGFRQTLRPFTESSSQAGQDRTGQPCEALVGWYAGEGWPELDHLGVPI